MLLCDPPCVIFIEGTLAQAHVRCAPCSGIITPVNFARRIYIEEKERLEIGDKIEES